uniref:Vascular endothelial growth factor Ab n=1 Tax=Cyprinus carpio TaxID=7962 RepID=A0A8C2B751_CYPCA
MSNLLSETFTNAFAKVRLSSDRVLKRFFRLINSIMNFAVRVLQLFLVTLLYFSAVKSAYIPREGGRSTYDVVPFMEVYNKSLCRPREVLVEIQQEYPDDTEHIFIPSCVVLTRCAGCCNDEMMECAPTVTYNITLEIKRLKPLRHQGDFFMSFAEHSECKCRPRKDVLEKKEKKPRKGKGQKRKRKKNSEKKRDLYVTSAFASSHLHLSVAILVVKLIWEEILCLL